MGGSVGSEIRKRRGCLKVILNSSTDNALEKEKHKYEPLVKA